MILKKNYLTYLLSIFVVFSISSQSFVTTWETSVSNDPISIGVGDFTYDFSVDWGDGSAVQSFNFTGGSENDPSNNIVKEFRHTYASIGIHTVTITPNVADGFPAIRMGRSENPSKIKTVKDFGNIAFKDFSVAFSNCSNLTIDTAAGGPTFDTNVTNFSIAGAFKNCTSLTTINASSWNTTNVKTAHTVFQGATNFNDDLSSWNMASVTTINNMFNNATSFNGAVTWTTTALTLMAGTFKGANSFNQDISGWNVSGATNMSETFQNATSFNQDISGWNVSNVTNMRSLFNGATAFNQNISSWALGTVNLLEMLKNATNFNQDISIWNFSNVTTMNHFLAGATAFSNSNYDALLSSWGATSTTKPIISNVSLAFRSDIVYCSDAAVTARQNLIDNQNFTFTNDVKCHSFTVSETALSINEGGSKTFTVKLDNFPSGNVVIDITSNNTSITANKSSLTFTQTTWDTPVAITVNGVNNDIDNVNISGQITATINQTGTLDNRYKSVDSQQVAITIIDDDTADVIRSTSTIQMNTVDSETFTVKLNTEPTQDVVINIASSDATKVTVSPSSVTFNATNWNSEKEITLVGASEGNASINLTVDSSSASEYTSVQINSISVEVSDNTAGVEDANENAFKLFPNPIAKGQDLQLYFTDNVDYFNVKVYNSLGKQIFNSVKENNTLKRITVPTNNLSTGMYFIQINTDNSKSVRKLVIN